MLVRYLFRMVTALDIPRDGLHRPRPVQSDDCGDILDRLRLQTGDHIGDTCAFQLEHAHRRATAEHFIGGLVVHIHLFDIERRQAAADHLFRVRNHRQVAQAKEIHLEQPKLLERGHWELGHHLLVVACKRHIGINRVFGDDHARRMCRCMARHALKRTRGVDQFTHLRLFVIHLFQLGIDCQCFVDRDVQLIRHLLCYHVNLVIRDIERAANITDGAARGHRTKGDDLRNAVLAVLFGNILDHLGAAHITEIDVDIRHGHALRVEEPFKIERIVDWVKIGDAEAVGHNRTRRRTAPRPDRDTLPLGITDKIRYDQEVIDKAHAGNHINLILQTRAHRTVVLGIPHGKSLVA